MSDHFTIRFEQKYTDLIDEAEDAGLGSNGTEAVKALLDAGAMHHGLNGHAGNTQLQRVVSRLADAFAFAGIIFIGLTFWFSVEVRAVALASTWGAAVVLYGLDRVLARYEPRMSARLPWGGGA
jgi:hypothetical protein